MKRNKVVAVDFDGTCVTHEYPEIGADVPHAVEVLKRLNENNVRIIVWTMRCGEYLDFHAKEWFEERAIEVWAFNQNTTEANLCNWLNKNSLRVKQPASPKI